MLAKLEKQTQMLFEHKPKELRVAVNGNFQGTLKVTSDLNEIDLLVANKELIEFIEIYSEQQMRLLFVNIENTVPHPTQDSIHTLTLSDGRKLELNFGFAADGAEIKLRYEDPTFKEVQMLLDNPHLLDKSIIPPISPKPQSTVSQTFFSHLTELFSKLTYLFSFGWRHLAFTALTISILVSGFIFFESQNTLSADAILKESEIRSLNWQTQPGKIIHWVDEEIITEGEKKRKYSSYRWSNNLSENREELILKYNEQNQLFLGRWTKSDGTLILFNNSNKWKIKIFPGIPQIRQSLPTLNEADRVVMEKHLRKMVEKVNVQEVGKINADWLIKNSQQKTADNCDLNGKKSLCVILDYVNQNGSSSRFETYFDKETLHRLFFKVTKISNDGQKSFEEAQTVLESESTLQEYENNELARLIALGQNIEYVSVADYAEHLRPQYPTKKQ